MPDDDEDDELAIFFVFKVKDNPASSSMRLTQLHGRRNLSYQITNQAASLAWIDVLPVHLVRRLNCSAVVDFTCLG